MIVNLFVITLIISTTYAGFRYLFVNNLRPFIFNGIFFYHLFFIFLFFVYAKTNDSDSLKYFTDGQAYTSTGNLLSFGSNLIIAISSFFIKNINANYLSLNIIFGSFATLGLLFMANLIEKKLIKKKFIFYILLMILFLPSLNFFTSCIGKDSLMFLFACLLVWSLDDYNHNKFLLIIISIFFMIITRLYIGIPISILITLFFPLIVEKKFSKTFYICYYLTFIILIIFALYFLKEILVKAGIISELGGLSPNPDAFNFEYLKQRMSTQFQSTSGANSGYKDLHENYLFYYFKYIFGPHLSEPQAGFRFILTKIETQFYILMILSIFFFTGMSFKEKPLLYKNIMFLMIFFSITIPLSLSISNYGISVRQRVIFYPFIIYILSSNIRYFFYEKKTNFNIFKSNYS